MNPAREIFGPYWWKIAIAGAVTALVSDYMIRRMGAR